MIATTLAATSSNGSSLPALRRTSVGARTCRNTISPLLSHTRSRQASANHINSRYLLVLHLDQRRGSPAAALGHRLLVGRKVEGEEEEEVRRDDADAGDGGELLAFAFAHVGDVGPVGAGEVGPGREVDEAWNVLVGIWGMGREKRTEIEDELCDLADGDVLLPPDADAARTLEVVPVHDHVNSQVQCDDGP